jgi:hypothetical protein
MGVTLFATPVPHWLCWGNSFQTILARVQISKGRCDLPQQVPMGKIFALTPGFGLAACRFS